MWVAKVPRKDAEEVRYLLWRKKLIDARRKVEKDRQFIKIPLLRRDVTLSRLKINLVKEEGKPKAKPVSPYERIRGRIRLPEDLKGSLPRRWELVGDVLILKIPPNLMPYRGEIAQVYAKQLKAKAVLQDLGGIEGEFRKPKVEIILGEETETIHKENGVLFKLDVMETMFSSGNIGERVRMGSISSEGETVVDMFAGIGYFSLPMAIHSNPARIYACEKSPVAYGYLCQNIGLNRVEDVIKPIFGDCRDVSPEGVADRIVMGYIKESHKFLPKALRVLNGRGWVHYHEACPNELLPRRPLERLEKAFKGWKMRVGNYHLVKSYAPGVSHVVVDAYVEQ